MGYSFRLITWNKNWTSFLKKIRGRPNQSRHNPPTSKHSNILVVTLVGYRLWYYLRCLSIIFGFRHSLLINIVLDLVTELHTLSNILFYIDFLGCYTILRLLLLKQFNFWVFQTLKSSNLEMSHCNLRVSILYLNISLSTPEGCKIRHPTLIDTLIVLTRVITTYVILKPL